MGNSKRQYIKNHGMNPDLFPLCSNCLSFYPTALNGCRGVVFTHGVLMGGRAVKGKSLSGMFLRNYKV